MNEYAKHKSCGVILHRIRNGKTEYLLLLQRKSKSWSFPKGHMEYRESERQTAIREVFEETGIKINALSDLRFEITYTFNGIGRTIVLFSAEINEEPVIDDNEIENYRWVTADEAKKMLHSDYTDIIDRFEEITLTKQKK